MDDNTQVQEDVTGSGQPELQADAPVLEHSEEVPATPLPSEHYDVDGGSTADDNTRAVDSKPLEKGVQLVHIVDENPEDHIGAEVKDPWNESE